ncbi:MAG: hypothetical protein KAS49_02900 [Candidatus Cloacimonetes bacterium]|nr:hypothetical protein [Candidatus Cloacimonadota bacterium]
MKKKFFLLTMLLVSSIYLFGLTEAKDVVSVKVVNDTLEATFVIPEEMHLTIQEDYFYLDVDPIEGITFAETVYPDGEADEDGYINLHGTVKLTKKFTLVDSINKANVTFKVYTGYQFCHSSYCEPPVDLEYLIPLLPIKAKQDSTKSQEEMEL